MAKKNLKILIAAGEASGDSHAAKVVEALREARRDADIEFFGIAGPKMREAGVEPVVMADELSIVGLAEIGRALPIFLRAFRKIKHAADTRKPDVAVLVDFPDFNLKLARSLKRRGIGVVYYISPQLWAWRQYRIRTIRKYVDLLITILPFEKDWYAARGVTHVEYIGSPLAREVHVGRSKEEFCSEHLLDPSKSIITLLPGSRHKEIVRILPVMIEATERVRESVPGIQFVVPVSSAANRIDVERLLNASGGVAAVVEGETYDAVNASDAAAVASGTATLETGIIGTPMVVVYKTSQVNYSLLEPMIDVPYYGLINLIAEKGVARELIQSAFTAEALANELIDLLRPERNIVVREELKAAAEKLGHGGASRRAAETILRVIG